MSQEPYEHRKKQGFKSSKIIRLNILAALVWYGGGVVLLLKGGSLCLGAAERFPGALWPWGLASAGFLLGALKGKLFFSKSCKKNLNRISSLMRPRLWQFFSQRFFLFLLLMISAGFVLSRLAHSSLLALAGATVLDLAVGTALLLSGRVFWREKAFSQITP